MLKKFGLVLAILALVFCPMLVMADFGDEATIGGQDSSGNYRWRVNSTAIFPGANTTYDIGTSTLMVEDVYYDGLLVPSSNAGQKASYEVVTTNDTLTAAETGKTVIVSSATNGAVITLPEATSSNLGLKYTVVDGKASGTSCVYVDVNANDTIRYSPSGSALSAGERIQSTATTGDAVTLISGAANSWYVSGMNFNWTNGG